MCCPGPGSSLAACLRPSLNMLLIFPLAMVILLRECGHAGAQPAVHITPPAGVCLHPPHASAARSATPAHF